MWAGRSRAMLKFFFFFAESNILLSSVKQNFSQGHFILADDHLCTILFRYDVTPKWLL